MLFAPRGDVGGSEIEGSAIRQFLLAVLRVLAILETNWTRNGGVSRDRKKGVDDWGCGKSHYFWHLPSVLD
jgi:hypothetical protein